MYLQFFKMLPQRGWSLRSNWWGRRLPSGRSLRFSVAFWHRRWMRVGLAAIIAFLRPFTHVALVPSVKDFQNIFDTGWSASYKGCAVSRCSVSRHWIEALFFCSVSVSKTQFLGIGGVKDTLPLCSKDTLNASKNLDTVPVSAIADC